MVVHIYGHPADMESICDIAARHNLPVIEDAAEAHGAEVNGRRVGSIADIAAFSFYGNKILTTGEGGMVTTNNARLAERCRLLRNQAFTHPRFEHEEVGFNYRLTNVQAAIGLAQVEMAEQKVEKKQWIGSAYNDRLIEQRDFFDLPHEAQWARNVYWMYGIVLKDGFNRGRDETMALLHDKGVETRAFFCPMHAQPVFRNGGDPRYPDVAGDYPVSDRLWERGLYLPSGEGLSEAEIDRVVEALLECRG